ncbi:MAG: histidine phosphatase family protein [Candidatus Eremiobacteraeota bacterium]|nr:histidine phosphatase family protein [Candidatus Eremiobacteraeota bacterium]MBC5803987.1 histidine phosphatase family protein [Candidatus Eremiobacteraeota bacterium]MBC5821926.1 histidine phosphatase family protein [Candidatus Eremiobacteraeota bacterium]
MIWLARHGETAWNIAGRYQGRLESSLTSRGMQQAIALAEHVAALWANGQCVPRRLVSSPLERCTATAQQMARRLHLDVETDARLIEIAHGTWEGRYKGALERDDFERYRLWRDHPERVVFPGGESLADVRLRWKSFAAELLRHRQNTLVVTHDAVIRCALLEIQGRALDEFWTVRVENGAYAAIASADGGFTVVHECVADFLGNLRADSAGQAL